jgi:hypothetical protein
MQIKNNCADNLNNKSINASHLNSKLIKNANGIELMESSKIKIGNESSKNLEKEKDKIKKNNNANFLRIGNYDGIKIILCKKICSLDRRKSKALAILESFFNKKMDLIFYFKSSIKLDIMKEIMFSKTQGLIFEAFNKPNIFDEEEIKTFGYNEFHEQSNFKEKEKLIIDYYKEKIINNQLDETIRNYYSY